MDSKGKKKKLMPKLLSAKRLRWALAVLAVAATAAVLIFLSGGSGESDESGYSSETYTVRRGDLTISVTESGDIKALNSEDIKSEVEGRTTIISIVDEGTIITADDVNNGMVLVELDSSDIEQKLSQQEVRFLDAEAGLAEAKESLEIQIKQNESDIKKDDLKVKFALMDLKKYLGENIVDRLIKQLEKSPDILIDMTAFIEDAQLSGEALQKLREREGDIRLKRQELELATSKLDWTKKLYEKKYVSLNDKEADELDWERKQIALDKAVTAKELFIKYEFPKQAEKFLSDYDEARRELERTEARARAKLAKAQAKLANKQATYQLQKKYLEKLEKQFKACVIKAPAPGQVVYSSSMGSEWERRNRPIEIGATIRERQKIISIPDPTIMKIEVKIPETWIDKVQPEQKANITVTAFPDKPLTGRVVKKSPLADPESWMNPDLKVYTTDVAIDGTHDYLKTGMTGKVEIIIEKLDEVISVPIQTVVSQGDKKICFVAGSSGPEKREVQTGAFNDDFVEIKKGLAEGEKVLLNPPRITSSEKDS